MSEKISLLLVHDQELLRAGMRIILDVEEDLTVVGEAENCRDAIETLCFQREELPNPRNAQPVIRP